jgi:hypothetical protein
VQNPHSANVDDVPVSSPGAWSPAAEGYAQEEEHVPNWQENTHREVSTENTHPSATHHFSQTEFGQTPANWFTLEHVDSGQPSQFRVLGEQSERSNSQPIDLDGYQENLVSSEDNVIFGLSLHGQYR